jgi:protease-4
MESIPTPRRNALYAGAVVAALLAGAVLAPTAWGYTARPDGTVAVVNLDGAITPASAEGVVADLERAREDDSIDAVVLRVNSPGGTVAASESIYLAVRRTAAEKPVVANVAGQAASGGYMALLASDTVYATPSSQLGSVGVYAGLPPLQLSDVDGVVTTAPSKGTAGTPEEVHRSVERMKRTFVGLVMDERGEELTVDRETVSRAKVYNGVTAVENGFADEIGGRDAAIEAAADRADVDDYDVVTIETEHTEPTTNASLAFENVETTRYLALNGLPAGATTRHLVTADGTTRSTLATNETDPHTGGARP